MNLHYYNGHGCGYPVGSNITNAINLAKNAAIIFNKMKEYNSKQPINIWCRGSSGAILAALFALYIKKKRDVYICHVKKEGESSHITQPCPASNAINIIIDDFISSGETIRAIKKKMESNSHYNVDCLIVGGQYSDSENEAESDLKRQIRFVPSNLITNKMR